MADLAVLAIGFGVMPLAAILLYAVSSDVLHHREAAWGILAGVTLFLGLSHAMALVLTYHSLLGDRALATLLSTLGLAVGTGIGWLLLEGPYIRTEPHRGSRVSHSCSCFRRCSLSPRRTWRRGSSISTASRQPDP